MIAGVRQQQLDEIVRQHRLEKSLQPGPLQTFPEPSSRVREFKSSPTEGAEIKTQPEKAGSRWNTN